MRVSVGAVQFEAPLARANRSAGVIGIPPNFRAGLAFVAATASVSTGASWLLSPEVAAVRGVVKAVIIPPAAVMPPASASSSAACWRMAGPLRPEPASAPSASSSCGDVVNAVQGLDPAFAKLTF
jgi:hypothetical protein